MWHCNVSKDHKLHSSKLTQIIYIALIQPYFDYSFPLWDTCGTQLFDKLQKFKNRAQE